MNNDEFKQLQEIYKKYVEILIKQKESYDSIHKNNTEKQKEEEKVKCK